MEGGRLLLLLLLLLPLCRGHQDYQGKVMTYYTLENLPDGTVKMAFRYRSNSMTCISNGNLCPSDGCGGVAYSQTVVDKSSDGFCQVESIWTRTSSSTAPFILQSHRDLWTTPIMNDVITARASIHFDQRPRSDTGHANRCPQTTILPVFRVPVNCPRNIQLLSFDPDGDLVQCRFSNASIDPTECKECTPPSVLSLSPSCVLSFRGSGKGSQGRYAVQLVMQDFPRTSIELIQTSGDRDRRDPDTALSKIPVQFLFLVEAPAPSCSSGLYLPRFVDPTPPHGSQITSSIQTPLRIHIQAQADEPGSWELVFSGPSRMTESGSGSSGQFSLSWTPVMSEVNQSHPVCFSAQTHINSFTFSSELRCLVLNVKEKMRLSSPSGLTEGSVWSALVHLFRAELVKRGLPSHIVVGLDNGVFSVRASEGAGSEGTGSEGAGSEGVGSEGAWSEGAGSEGAGSEGAGSEGAGSEGPWSEEA